MTFWDLFNQHSNAIFPILAALAGTFMGFVGNWMLEKGRRRKEDKNYKRDKLLLLNQDLTELQFISETLSSDFFRTLLEIGIRNPDKNTSTSPEKFAKLLFSVEEPLNIFMKGIQKPLITSNAIAFLLFPKISSALHNLQKDIYTFKTIPSSVYQSMVDNEITAETFFPECYRKFTALIHFFATHEQEIHSLLKEESAKYQ